MEVRDMDVHAFCLMPNPERVEKAVSVLFADTGPARGGRLLLYAQRMHSMLGAVEIERRGGRRHSAVGVALRAIAVDAQTSTKLAARLSKLTQC